MRNVIWKRRINGTNTHLTNDEVKLLLDVNIQCDHVTEARRPGIVVVNKQEKKSTITDIAVPADKRIGEKENE